MEVGDIGTHSAWKGVASGCTISPAMAAICNHAGWALGGSRDKYIKYEAAGDQFLGRTLCGLDPLSISFSVSPPFFDLGNAGIAELDSWIHRLYEDCQGAVHSNTGRLTGISTHIAILNKMQKLEKLVVDGFGGLCAKLEEMGLGSEAYQASTLLDEIRDVKNDLKEAVANMNRGDVAQARIDKLHIEEEGGRGRERLERRTRTFYWGGQFHALPQNFVLPISMDMCTVICYWYVGSKQPLVPPLKFTKAVDFPQQGG